MISQHVESLRNLLSTLEEGVNEGDRDGGDVPEVKIHQDIIFVFSLLMSEHNKLRRCEKQLYEKWREIKNVQAERYRGVIHGCMIYDLYLLCSCLFHVSLTCTSRSINTRAKLILKEGSIYDTKAILSLSRKVMSSLSRLEGIKVTSRDGEKQRELVENYIGSLKKDR